MTEQQEVYLKQANSLLRNRNRELIIKNKSLELKEERLFYLLTDIRIKYRELRLKK